LPPAVAWVAQDRLDKEFESIGFYLSGHPLDEFFASPSGAGMHCFADLADLQEGENRSVAAAAVLRRMQARPAQSGGQFAYVTLSDPTGEYEAIVMPEALDACREALSPGSALAFRLRTRWRDGEMRLSADSFEPIEAAEARSDEDLEIILREGASPRDIAAVFESLPKTHAGEMRRLRLILRLSDGRDVEIMAPGRFPAGAAARAAVKSGRGVERVR
jgi:DNA polymerase-3 subunit alpha